MLTLLFDWLEATARALERQSRRRLPMAGSVVGRGRPWFVPQGQPRAARLVLLRVDGSGAGAHPAHGPPEPSMGGVERGYRVRSFEMEMAA